MKRLFIAIKVIPDKDFLARFHDLKAALHHERIKWVEEQNIHITLKFFGETDEKLIPDIIRIMEKVATGRKPFSMSLQKLGIFGSSYEPRVIWTGIEPYRDIADIMKAIHSEMKTIGFEPDRQNLVPHLTLGRIKSLVDKQLFQKTLERYKEIASREMVVDSFVLFESILRKEGPEYHAVNVVKMSNEE
jgi:2'-5' RNA ligase